MNDEPHSVGDVLDRLKALGDEEPDGRVELGEVVEALGSRSYGPFLLVPALIEMSPIGGVPGVPTFLALLIALFAAQMLADRGHLWLPAIIVRRGVKGARMARATGRLRGVARFMDRWFHGRLRRLTKPPFTRLAAACCIALALTVPPLELLPFASTAPMLAIAAFGLALLVRDGALMIGATCVALAAVALSGFLLVTHGLGGA